MDEKQKIILIIIDAIIIFYLFSTTPLYLQIVGLGPNDTAFDFQRVPVKTQVAYMMGPGCLTPKLSDYILMNDLGDKVNDLFTNRVRTAFGQARLGDLYKNSALTVARRRGFKGQ